MNGAERIRAALAGEPVDRPPVWMMRQAAALLQAMADALPSAGMVGRREELLQQRVGKHVLRDHAAEQAQERKLMRRQ